jgi:diguanylate cyclase (GGDEF)-like protein
MERSLAFIQRRNKVFNVALAILFTIGLAIELSTRKQPEALVMFSVSIIVFYSLYFFVVRKGSLVKPVMYFITMFILLFTCKSVMDDTNIVFYIAVLMFFTFISFYENIWLSITSAIVMVSASSISLLSKSSDIFTKSVLDTPDVQVFIVLNTFIYIFLIMQNRVSEKTRHELYETERTISLLAYNDALTGLPNRRAIAGEIGSKLEKAAKNNKQLAIVFIDMDKFKAINDNFGHEAGDELLISVANRLKSVAGDKGISARLGGDEFLILLHLDVDLSETKIFAQRVLDALQPPFTAMVNGQEMELDSTPSIGVSMYPNDGISVTALIQAADAAMYVAKQNGKNNFKFASTDATS